MAAGSDSLLGRETIQGGLKTMRKLTKIKPKIYHKQFDRLYSKNFFTISKLLNELTLE